MNPKQADEPAAVVLFALVSTNEIIGAESQPVDWYILFLNNYMKMSLWQMCTPELVQHRPGLPVSASHTVPELFLMVARSHRFSTIPPEVRGIAAAQCVLMTTPSFSS